MTRKWIETYDGDLLNLDHVVIIKHYEEPEDVEAFIEAVAINGETFILRRGPNLIAVMGTFLGLMNDLDLVTP